MNTTQLQLVPDMPRIRRARSRRGSVYVLVLGVSTMVAVVGLGAVMLSRSAIRATAASRDWSEAGIAAQSGLEYAVGVMNSSTTWRSDANGGVSIGPIGIGRAKVALTLVDETDGNLTNDPTQSVRVYALASVGGATRAYSAVAAVSSTIGLDVLRCPVYAAGNLTVSQNAVASGGPLSCASAMSNSATLTADVESGTLSSSGFINGYVQTGVAAKSMPDNTAWTTLAAMATTIPWPLGGNIDGKLLTAGVNTFGGSTNSSGVYTISVPALSTLTIHHSRLQATLLVTLGLSASLVVKEENLWDPADATKPTLLVQGGLLSSVTLQGGAAVLSEGPGKNYNPVGAPYNGVSDSDTTDTYANELHGVFHVTDTTPLTIAGNLRVVGCVLSAGSITINTAATLTANPSLLTYPPAGYSSAVNAKMRLVEGTYRWEVTNVNPVNAGSGTGVTAGAGP